MQFDEAVTLIKRARDFQDFKFGANRLLPDKRWLRILQEELGESSAEIESHDDARLRDELAQTAAVAFCWLECRRGDKIRSFEDVLDEVKEELKLQKAVVAQYEDHEGILCKVVVAVGEAANELENGIPHDIELEINITSVAALLIWWMESIPALLPRYKWSSEKGWCQYRANINGYRVGLFHPAHGNNKWKVRDISKAVHKHIRELEDDHLDRLKVRAEQYFENLDVYEPQP